MTDTNPTAPSDFDNYWQTVLDALAETPSAPEETWLPLRSGTAHRTYQVHLTSIGPYRISGYLSLPKGDGPFPAAYLFPRYMSVIEPLTQGLASAKREQCAVFALAARGHRNADQPYRAFFPGMLTERVEQPEHYPFRGVVADCVRGLEYLAEHPAIDRTRIALLGLSELPLLTAALRSDGCCISSHPGLFYRSRDLAPRFRVYPQEEINDYCRLTPEKSEQLFRTLSYFDPVNFVSRIESPTLLWAGAESAPWNCEELEPLRARFQCPVELKQGTGSTFEDGLFREHWVAQHQKTQPDIPIIWQR